MPAENQNCGRETNSLSEPSDETLDYFNPVENARSPWDPKELIPFVIVMLVAGYDFLALTWPRAISAHLGFFVPFVIPPIALLCALLYAVWSKPEPGWTLVLGAFVCGIGLFLHVGTPAAIYFLSF